MPSNTDSIGRLEVNSIDLQTLNDRLRRIAAALGGTEGTTASGAVSQIVLNLPGTLGVQQDVMPVLTVGTAFQPSTALAFVKRPPIGSPITLQLFVNGVAYGPTLTIGVGTKTTSLDFSGVAAIQQA